MIDPPIDGIKGETLNQKQLTIPANTLAAGSTYTLKALMFFINSDKEAISSASKIINVKRGPIGGSIQVEPNQGTAQVDLITISAPGWHLESPDSD